MYPVHTNRAPQYPADCVGLKESSSETTAFASPDLLRGTVSQTSSTVLRTLNDLLKLRLKTVLFSRT